MKGWYGDKQQHSLASKGIRTKTNTIRGNRLTTQIDVYYQLNEGKFPIVIHPDVDAWEEYIKAYAERNEIPEEQVRRAFSKVSLKWREFIDLYDIENEFEWVKDEAKDSYRELKKEAREDGWLDEVPKYRDFFIEEYGHNPTVKDYFLNGMTTEDKTELAYKIIDDVNSDLDYYGGFELDRIMARGTAENINTTMSNIEKDAEKTAKNVNEGLRKLKILAQRTARKTKEFAKETGQKIDKSAEDTAKTIKKISKKLDDSAEDTAKDIKKILR